MAEDSDIVLVVRSKDVRKRPLLVTDEADTVEWVDSDGRLQVVVRQIPGGSVLIAHRGAPDWRESLAQMGYDKDYI